jgi:CRISPR/Cas system-associated exonuclease Cas4 (RecB family)
MDKYSKFEDEPHNTAPLEIGTYRCSRITRCIRSAFFDFHIKKPYGDRTMRIFSAGKSVHAAVEKAFGTFGSNFDEVKTEVSLVKEIEDFRITGHADLLINVDGAPIIVELKSIKSLWEYDEAKDKYNIKDPQTRHLDQANLYMGMAGVKKAWIVYIQKNDLQVRTFVVDFDPEHFAYMVERAKRLHKNLKADVIPEAEFKMRGLKVECKRCLYKTECGQVGPGAKIYELPIA